MTEPAKSNGKAAADSDEARTAAAMGATLTVRFTRHEVSLLRGAIDVCIRSGGTQAAKQLMGLDAKLENADAPQER